MSLWQEWLLLRPLIVFVLACPLFVFAALAGLRKKRRSVEGGTEARKGAPSRFVLVAAGHWRFRRDIEEQPLPSVAALHGDCGQASATQEHVAMIERERV
jgi:hypothetical protein